MKIHHRIPENQPRPAPRRAANDHEIEAMREFMRLWLKEQKTLSPAMQAFAKRFSRVIGS